MREPRLESSHRARSVQREDSIERFAEQDIPPPVKEFEGALIHFNTVSKPVRYEKRNE